MLLLISIIKVDLDGAIDFNNALKGLSLLILKKMPYKLRIPKKKYLVKP